MKHIGYRSLAVFCMAVLLSVCALAVPVSAFPAVSGTETELVCTVRDLAAENDTSMAVENSELYRFLYQEIVSLKEEISLSRFQVSQAELRDVYQALHRRPELFYTDRSFRIKLRDGAVVSLMPGYTMDAETLIAAQRVYTETLDSILACVLPEWTDYQKVLFLHDALVTQYSYDDTLRNFDVYSFFTEGVGVCQAYSLAMCALLEALDIPNAYAVSIRMDHMWNLVQLDGAWYHLDVTWDDPVPDGTGFVCHTYFLCSDEKMRSAGHFGWDAPHACTDTRYDDCFVRAAASPFVPFDDGLWYYIDNTTGELCLWNGDPSSSGCETRKTGAMTFPWDGKNRGENGYFSGLVRLGDVLLYNSTDAVYAYHPKTGEIERMRFSEMKKTDVFCGICGKLLPAAQQSPELSVVAGVSGADGYALVSFSPKNVVTYTVRGTLTGYFAKAGNAAQITLYTGGRAVYRTTAARGTSYRTETSSFALTGVRAGTYELVVTQNGCLPVHISGFTVKGDTDLDTDARFASPSVRELFTLLLGDLNADGVIDATDRALLLSGGSFNRPVSGAASSVYDLNGDGYADFLDLAILTSASGWGKTAASRKIQLS